MHFSTLYIPLRLSYFTRLACLVVVAAELLSPVVAQTTSVGKLTLATPTPEQLAWQDLEIGMFIHFGMETYQDTEEDNFSTPLSQFNPTSLDTDQWVRVAESMHAKYIILVAKHVGGFCLWQTDSSPYGVKDTPWRDGKGDVLADLAKSCRKRGMLLGVYVYPGDLYHGSSVSSGGKTNDPANQEKYTKIYRQQLTEVLSRYGPMMEVWFDGSVRKDIMDLSDILQAHAPNAMKFQSPWATIRWIGNEQGIASYPAWSSVSREAAQSGVAEMSDGDPNGEVWLPNECDARIREGWFWSSKDAHTLKSVDELMDMYYRSVGHGSTLLLNIAPDITGRIPESDAKRAAEFGAEITRRFGVWHARTAGEGKSLDLAFDTQTTIDHVVTMEDIRFGERIRQYVIEGKTTDGWKPLVNGTMIGHKKIDRFDAIEISGIRMRVDSSIGTPNIRELAVFDTTATISLPKESISPTNQPEATGEFRQVGQWSSNAFKNGRAEFEIDLTEFVRDAGQFELVFVTEDESLDVVSIVLVLQGQKLPSHFVNPTADGNRFRLNITATPPSRPKWCIAKISLTTTNDHRSEGTIKFRQRPLK